MLLATTDPKRDIVLYINSPGGSVFAGLAIYDTMKLIPNDVVTVAMGFAASMGQVLLCSGTHGKRISLAHSRIMMHQPSAGIGGTAVDIAIQAESLELMKRQSQKSSPPKRAGPSKRSRPTAIGIAGSPPSRRASTESSTAS